MDKHKLLKEIFGHSDFRKGQETAVDCLMSGRDLLSVMPTGAGKSICYQLPALMLEGITLVVSPLISLMKDQAMSLIQNGVSAAFLNSSLSSEEYMQTLRMAWKGAYKIIFIAPERLETESFLEFAKRNRISMVTVDEAHCVSQWGQDFRPSYLHISSFIEALPERPVVGAFTATATDRVREDIKKQLGLADPLEIITGFDRPNLFFRVIHVPNKTKPAVLKGLLSGFSERSGIIYCATRKQTEQVYLFCKEQGIEAVMYHAGMTDADRMESQEDFIYDRARVMVATNAFGMGIDKSNVGFVIHYGMPKSPEAYYQEAGRAGRDGTAADCVLLYCPGDVNTAEYFINNMAGEGLTPAQLAAAKKQERKRLGAMVEYCNTADCLRAFLLNYFGEKCESCSGCSNCDTEFREEDITEDAQKIISCVYRLSQRGIKFASGAICSVLTGGRDKRTESFHLETLSTYGIMSDHNKKRVSETLDALVRQGYLSRSDEEYRNISITEKGHSAVKNREKITVKVPIKKSAAMSAYSEAAETSARFAYMKKPSSVGADFDEELYRKLKEVRSKEAAKNHLPVYMVFSNATLEDMAAKKPTTDEELLSVNGVGDAKLMRYGRVFIEAVKEYIRL
ncbi:MAG: DNA helicase RecQ [Bacteroides sp.]|nr:DNA helicase RecQ [Bacteroides sp.]